MSSVDNITQVPDLGNSVYDEDGAFRAMQNFIREQAKYERTPERGDINYFFEVVRLAIRSREAYERVPEDKRLLFMEDEPPEEINTEAITFYITARSPGQFNQGPAGSSRVKEVTAHIRGIIDHPEHPSEKLVVMGKKYDNWIKFYINARDKKVARPRVLWFERLMDNYNWFFRFHGYRVIEEGVGDREIKEVGDDQTIIRYPITYFVTSDDISHFSAQELKYVAINVQAATS